MQTNNKGAMFGLNESNETVSNEEAEYWEGPLNLDNVDYRVQMDVHGQAALLKEGEVVEYGEWDALESESHLVARIKFGSKSVSIFEEWSDKKEFYYYSLSYRPYAAKPSTITRVL